MTAHERYSMLMVEMLSMLKSEKFNTLLQKTSEVQVTLTPSRRRRFRDYSVAVARDAKSLYGLLSFHVYLQFYLRRFKSHGK